tara:strand:+ start:32220 stop:32990 length:771 start_codon:yes stop_codon:yes gene_type:complete
MQLIKVTTIFLVGFLSTHLVFAQASYSQNDNTDMSTTDLSRSSSRLSESDKAEARKWSLTDSDWVKYKQVMSGPRGVWSPGLDPITALGVSETDVNERRRYAEIWMKVETRRIGLELAFEKERLLAGKRLNGDTKMIENDAWLAEWNKKQGAVHKIINLFVDPACFDDCEDIARSVLDSVSNTSKLDIYFKPGSTEDEAGNWAAHFNIDPKIVATRRITLNLKGPKLHSFNIDVNDLPQVRVEDLEAGTVINTFGN